MNAPFRSLTLGLAIVLGSMAIAQPVPPYDIIVTGTITGCNPLVTSYVNITTQQGTQPSVDIDVPVDANCGFSVTLSMESFEGWFLVSTGCNGAVVSQTITYNADALPPDSNYVYVVLNCGANVPDCQGTLGGSALPGTECTIPGTTLIGLWSANCECLPTVTGCDACFTLDTLQTGPWLATFSNCSAGGTAPFTYFWTFDNGVTSTILFEPTIALNSSGTFTACLTVFDDSGCEDMVCDSFFVDANGGVFAYPVVFDCIQVPNGPNLPGTACNDPVTGENGIWNADCLCIPDTNSTDCQAGFWVIQAYEGDTASGEVTPIPNEVWVWNLSNGTSPFQFLWSFGDGTSSTEAYPTHVYATGGPYTLCLTMIDGAGCTSTYCDEVSIDENGIYTGLVVDGRPNMLRSGFTIRVRDQVGTGVQEEEAMTDLITWPNPVNDRLNLRFRSTLHGTVQLQLMDVNGRVLRTTNTTFSAGDNRIELTTGELPAGLYLLRMGQAGHAQSIRFVKD